MAINSIRPINAKESYPDRRSEQQRIADEQSARRQLAELTSQQSRDRVEKIIDDIRTYQAQSRDGSALPFERHVIRRSGAPETYVLVALDQLVVRVDAPVGLNDGPADQLTADFSPVRGPRDIPAALKELGYAEDRRMRSRDPRTAIFRSKSSRRPADLAADIENLRVRGISANMNVVVPLGHIIKGENFPTKTTMSTRFAPSDVGIDTSLPRVRVAVVDTGIGPDRGDGWLDTVARSSANEELLDILPKNDRLDWFSGHGTFASGVVQQVAPNCEIVVYRFTRNNGLGTEKEVAETLIQAAENAVEVVDGVSRRIPLIINASVGTPAIDGLPPLAMRDAVQFIEEKYPEVLIVASAGNAGTEEPMYPAAFKQVVAVGALTDDLRGAAFSSRGPWVDCSAIGVGVVSTFVEGVMPPDPYLDAEFPVYTFDKDPWAMWTGTSFSAPQIAGAVARLCQENPGLTPRAALTALLAGQPELPGFGRVVRLLPGTRT